MRSLSRIFVCLFAVLLAWPLCMTCARADDACRELSAALLGETADPSAMPADHSCCAEADDVPAAPVVPTDKSSGNCLHCKPLSASLAIDSAVPMPSLEPLASFDLLVLEPDAPTYGVGATARVEFHPPPPTLVRLHTMLTT